MASNYKINWQDKYLCDTILANRDNLSEDKLKYEYNFWAALLVKHYIVYDLCKGDSSIQQLKSAIENHLEEIKAKAREYVNDDSRIEKIIKGIKKNIEDLEDEDKENRRVFFADKPVVIYKSEIEAIKQIGKDFTYNSQFGKKPREILQKIIAVLLIWQKAYQNQYVERKEYVPVIEEKINNSKIFSDNGSESGTRIKNYQLLIENGLIEYYRPEIEYRKRKKNPIYLYKIPFISYNDDGTDEVVLTINKFELLCEQVFSCFTDKLYVNECQKCGKMFIAKRKSTKNCDICNRHY